MVKVTTPLRARDCVDARGSYNLQVDHLPWFLKLLAHAFVQHQFSHVINFWKQGRKVCFKLEAIPGVQLPPASEVVLLQPICSQPLTNIGTNASGAIWWLNL